MSRMIRRLRVSMRHACLSSLPNVCPGTDLAGIMESSEPLESGLAGNKAYVSGVLGIYTRIGFPYLNNLRSIKTCCLHKPDIDIEPQRSSAPEEQFRYKQKIIGIKHDAHGKGRYPPVYKHFPVNVLLTAGKGLWKSEKDDQNQNVQQWFD